MASELDDLDALVAGLEAMSRNINYDSDEERDPGATLVQFVQGPPTPLSRRKSVDQGTHLPSPMTLPPPPPPILPGRRAAAPSVPQLAPGSAATINLGRPSAPPQAAPPMIPGGKPTKLSPSLASTHGVSASVSVSAPSLMPPHLKSSYTTDSLAPIAPPPPAKPTFQQLPAEFVTYPLNTNASSIPPLPMLASSSVNGASMSSSPPPPPPPPPPPAQEPRMYMNPLLPELPPPPPSDLLTLTANPQMSTAPMASLPPPPSTSIKRPTGPVNKLQQLAREDKVILTVSNLDGSLKKSLEVSMQITGRDLNELVATKLTLPAADYFGVSFSGRNFDKFVDPQRSLRDQDVPKQLIFKVQYMKQPRHIDNQLAIQLYWLQVKTMVVSGYYAITDYLGVKLGALHLQIAHGDHDPSRHATGFFNHVNDLLPYLPQILVDRYRLQYWQRRLLAQYAKYRGMSTVDAQLEYMRVARKSPSFGASIFEIKAGAHALLGIAEDGILLSIKRNSMCGDWSFYPFEQLTAYNRTSIGISFQTKEVINLGMHDDEAESALNILHDYYSLFRVALDPKFAADVYLPPKELFDLPPKRIMLSSFPSRLELFKDSYQRCVTEANTRPLLMVLESIDRDLDEGKNCDVLDLAGVDLADDQWSFIRKALTDTFSFKPTPGQIFVENFTVNELRLSNNPHLSPAAIESMIPLFSSSFPARVINFSNNNKFNKDHAKALTGLLNSARRVDSLIMNDTELGDQNALMLLKSIKTNVIFRNLNFARTGLTDGFFFPLALIIQGHPSLADLDLAGNSISDDGCVKLVEGIRASRSVVRLNLTSTKVRSHSIKRLLDIIGARGRPNHFEVANTKLSFKTALKIASLLQLGTQQNNLFYLDVHNTNLTKKGAIAIAASLENNKSLETLAIGSNELDKDFMIILARSLKNNNKLKMLSLRGSHLGSDGYEALAQILRFNGCLVEVDVSSNSIQASDCKVIADALTCNKSLSSLNMSSNPKIGPEGAGFILANLSRSNLSKLILDGCNVGDSGLKKICDCLSTADSIERLSLRENGITTAGLKPFVHVFQRNSKLLFLHLDRNNIALSTLPELIDPFYSAILSGRQITCDEDIRTLILDPTKTVKRK